MQVSGVINKVWDDAGKKNYAFSIGEDKLRISGWKPVHPKIVEGAELTVEYKQNGDFKNLVSVSSIGYSGEPVDEEQEAKADLIRKYDMDKESDMSLCNRRQCVKDIIVAHITSNQPITETDVDRWVALFKHGF